MRTDRAITLAILAMGGEGGGVLADWIVDMAEHAGYLAQSTSVPGVAQRTGTTIYYLEMFPESGAQNAGHDPVFALMPVPGEVDIVIASELMEAARAVQRGIVTSDRTTLIASTNRVYSMTEKTALADGRVDSEELLGSIAIAARKLIHRDFSLLARDSGSVISAVLFGALAGSGTLPFNQQQFEDAIIRSGVSVESSLSGFIAGWNSVSGVSEESKHETAPEKSKISISDKLKPLADKVCTEFPLTSHEFILAGIARLADFQDIAYAEEYLTKLRAILTTETQYRDGDHTLLRETSRYLALWMSYEDASRVAQLKIRRERFERVRKEVSAGPEQILTIHEYVHPRIQEIADTMPRSIGLWMLQFGQFQSLLARFTKRGQIVQTTSLSGFLLLYLVSCQRWWRRSSLRFSVEHAEIGKWLDLISRTAEKNYALAVAIAESAQLVKGYGDTHQRGSRNFASVLAALPQLADKTDASVQIKKLVVAALSDDSGKSLAGQLVNIKL